MCMPLSAALTLLPATVLSADTTKGHDGPSQHVGLLNPFPPLCLQWQSLQQQAVVEHLIYGACACFTQEPCPEPVIGATASAAAGSLQDLHAVLDALHQTRTSYAALADISQHDVQPLKAAQLAQGNQLTAQTACIC